MMRARMRSPRRTVSRCSGEYDGDPSSAVARRLIDGLRANSFTSLRSAPNSSGRGLSQRVCTIETRNKTSHRSAHFCGPL